MLVLAPTHIGVRSQLLVVEVPNPGIHQVIMDLFTFRQVHDKLADKDGNGPSGKPPHPKQPGTVRVRPPPNPARLNLPQLVN